MKVLEILKNRIGAISRGGLLSVALTSGLVVLNVYNYMTDKPKALDPQIRSLSQIISSGGELPSEYSGISLSASGVNFATAEEQAAHEGAFLAKFDGGEAQVEALDKIDALNVRGSVFRGGEAGLGLNQRAVEVGPNGTSNAGGASANGDGVGDAVAEANKTVINKLSEAKSSLPRASMARVNASGSSSSYSPYGNTGNTNGGPSVPATKVGPASISGAPTIEGTTLVHTPTALRGATGSDFVASSRNVNYRGGGLNSKEGNSLRSIAVQSAKVAATSGKSANMHAQVFMTEDVKGPGTQETADTFTTTMEGNTIQPPPDPQIDPGEDFDNYINEIDTTEQEKKAHRTRLIKSLISLVVTTFMAMVAIAALTKSPPWGYVGAAAITALVLALVALFVIDASEYCNKFENVGNGWLWIAGSVGVVMAAGIALSWIGATNGWLQSVGTFLGKGVGAYLISPLLSTFGLGMSIETQIEAINSRNEDPSELNNK